MVLTYVKMINTKDPHKFIFIDVPKNASSAIRDSLMTDLNIEYKPMNFSICPNHECASLYDKHNFDTTGFFKFGFVRNPWDRVVSMYEYSRIKPHGKRYGSFDNFVNYMYESYHNIKSNSWDPMLNDVNQDYIAANGESVRLNWTTQMGWLENNGEMWVDFIGRFENLHEDMCKVYETLNINKKPNLTKVNHSTRKKDYRIYYNEDLINKVGEINKKDIELFNYEF